MVACGSAAEAAVIHPTDGYELRFLEVGSAGVVERRDALAMCWATRFEDVPPVRQFPSYQGQRSFSGEYFASCMGRHVGFESWLERDQLMMLDFSPRVESFAAQPFWLSWQSGDRTRRHAPDFFVRMVDGRGVVVDVRADDRIGDEDAAAFAVTAAACESVGWDYRRVGAVDPVLSANVRWLAGYRHHRCLNDAHRDLLMEAFSRPSALLAGVEAVGDRLAVLPSLFHLMWTGVLVADLVSAPLTGRSVVRVAGGCE